MGDFDEKGFQKWYRGHAEKAGINPNPDDPAHFYDYRAAYSAGAEPSQNKEGKYKWPSTFKKEGHPNMIVDGVNTKTGKPATFEESFDEAVEKSR